jgi:hypothetical protein
VEKYPFEFIITLYKKFPDKVVDNLNIFRSIIDNSVIPLPDLIKLIIRKISRDAAFELRDIRYFTNYDKIMAYLIYHHPEVIRKQFEQSYISIRNIQTIMIENEIPAERIVDLVGTVSVIILFRIFEYFKFADELFGKISVRKSTLSYGEYIPIKYLSKKLFKNDTEWSDDMYYDLQKSCIFGAYHALPQNSFIDEVKKIRNTMYRPSPKIIQLIDAIIAGNNPF